MDSIKSIGMDGLRDIGLSSVKVSYIYIYNIMDAIESGKLNFDCLREKDDETVIKDLKKIKGIRNWTVKMYLIFVLGREKMQEMGTIFLSGGKVYV